MPDRPRAAPDDPPPRAGPVWRVRLLGGFELRNGDVVIPGFGERVLLHLFARLALEPRVTHDRRALARVLWPARADDEAFLARNLSKRLSDLRRRFLEPPGFRPAVAIESLDDGVRLNAAAFDIDVDRFERAVRQRHWQAARDLHGGPLLAGLDDPRIAERRAELAGQLALVDRELGRGVEWLPPPDGDDGADAPAPVAFEPPGLVAYTTRFFGRRDEIAELDRQVAARRLVVLHGAPGSGKSRLASEAARTGFAGFEERLRASLALCRSLDDAVDAVRIAAGVGLGDGPPIRPIATRLASRRALIVLDDFEHLVGRDGDALIDLLLSALPLAHLLITTRRALDRPDAAALAVGPLPLPAAGRSAREALANPAVALFDDRGRSARSHFKVHGRNVATVVEICRHLDGMPLAVELAAAAVHRLPLTELRDELLRSTRRLARGQRRGDRDGSLETALHLSWRLLGDDERQLLRSLAVFRGGFTLAQVRAVAGVGAVGAGLEALARDALLLSGASSTGVPRLGLQAPVRDFAEAQLDGPEAAALRRRHREHFSGLLPALQRQGDWPDAADLPNLAAAMEYALDDDEPLAAARIALSLARMWRARGASASERALIARTAEARGQRPRPRALLHALLAVLEVNAGDGPAAAAQAERAREAAGTDATLRAEARLAQAAVAWLSDQDGPRTRELVHEAGSLLSAVVPPDLRVRYLLARGQVALIVDGDPAAAQRLTEQADRLLARRRDLRGVTQLLPLRTAILLGDQRHDEVLRLCERGEEQASALGLVIVQLQLMNRQAIALEALRRLPEAVAVLQRQVRLAVSHGSTYHVAFAAWNQCQPLAELGRARDAAELLGFAHAYWERQFGGFTDHDRLYTRAVRAAVVARASVADWRRWRARGRQLPDRDGLALASGEPAASD